MTAGDKELLDKVALFHKVQPATLEAIRTTGIPRSVEEDSFYFHQEDPATHVYVLTSGRVKLHQVTIDGQQVALRVIAPGMMFGGIALLQPGSGYPAAAQAMEDSAALAWEGMFLRKLAEKDSTLAINMMGLMSGYVEEMQARFRELATERVEQRVARALLRLAAQSGQKASGGIELSLTRQDLAELTGATLFTVSRLLAGWERQGLIHAGRERVTLLHPHALVRIADGLAE
jgi:CRP-like cAMP-binding protein